MDQLNTFRCLFFCICLSLIIFSLFQKVTKNLMEEEVRNQIREKSISALESKLALLSSAVESVQQRNEELKSLPEVNKKEILEIQTNLPDQQTLKEFYEARERLQKSKRKYENLKKANEQLNDRLLKGEKLLRQEKEKAKFRNIQMLSPTAAKIINQQLAKEKPQQNSIQGQTLEIEYLKKQLQAIRELKNGAVPRPHGTIDINFDELIEAERQKLDEIQQRKERNKQRFTSLLEKCLSEGNTLQESIDNHSEFANAFAHFQSSYNRATDNIDALPFVSLLGILKEQSSKTTREGLEAAIDSLNREKEMIIDRLEKMGVDDEESVDLKHEIQVKLLHLAHITAVAEKGLCKLSARKPPVDPLETMKIENTEMELED